MANATPQKFNVQLTRSQLDLLEKCSIKKSSHLNQAMLIQTSTILTQLINIHFCCNLHAANTTPNFKQKPL